VRVARLVPRELAKGWAEAYSACFPSVPAAVAAVDGASAEEGAVGSCQVGQWVAVAAAGNVLEVRRPVLVEAEEDRTVPEAHIPEAADLQSSYHSRAQLQVVPESHARRREH
jgi:hypothetical protein